MIGERRSKNPSEQAKVNRVFPSAFAHARIDGDRNVDHIAGVRHDAVPEEEHVLPDDRTDASESESFPGNTGRH